MPIPQHASDTPIENLDDAKNRIAELEKALDDTIDIIIKRDAQLSQYERQLIDLETKIAELTNKD